MAVPITPNDTANPSNGHGTEGCASTTASSAINGSFGCPCGTLSATDSLRRLTNPRERQLSLRG